MARSFRRLLAAAVMLLATVQLRANPAGPLEPDTDSFAGTVLGAMSIREPLH